MPAPVFLSGESHGQRSLVGYSPRGRKESDTTERLTHTHTIFYIAKLGSPSLNNCIYFYLSKFNSLSLQILTHAFRHSSFRSLVHLIGQWGDVPKIQIKINTRIFNTLRRNKTTEV